MFKITPAFVGGWRDRILEFLCWSFFEAWVLRLEVSAPKSPACRPRSVHGPGTNNTHIGAGTVTDCPVAFNRPVAASTANTAIESVA